MADINIYGKLVNQLEDGRLADTTQIYDPNLQKFQSEINQSSATIDDTGTSLTSTWSSSKIQAELGDILPLIYAGL